MHFIETPIAGAWLVELEPRGDERGHFARVWCEEEFRSRGLSGRFVQCNTSRSRHRATLRGLHWQAEPHGEVKLVRCIRGAVYDVIADVRPDSPTRGRWFGAELTADGLMLLYVPAGCAHGYETLVDDSEVMYPVSTPYVASAERGVRWNDPAFDIRWPLVPQHLSAKDTAWPDFPGEASVHRR